MNPLSVSQQKTEEALRHLESQGFEVKQLWRELTARGEARADEAPPPEDCVHCLPKEAPQIESHFVDGVAEVLQVSKLWEGYSYSLTAGQRELLREMYGMTPSQTVTVTWIEKWPHSDWLRSLRIQSDVHVDPRLRRHLFTAVVIKTTGKFFAEAERLDNVEVVKLRSFLDETSLAVGKVFNLEPEEKWAIEDLSGVKVQAKIEVTMVSPETFTVQDTKTGNIATVNREVYFKTVEEYFTAYKEDRKTVGKKSRAPRFDPPSALDDLVKSLLANPTK